VNLSPAEPIRSLDELRNHLQYAIGIELATIPAYLYALYSIEEGKNTTVAEVIQSVVLEEMLHMTLAANVLNAIGGVPSPDPVTGPEAGNPIPVYPATVPFIDQLPPIHLRRFSPEAVDTFLRIEQPAEPGAPAGPAADGQQYASIGEFYAAIEEGLQTLGTDEVFAEARRSRPGCQVPPRHYYGGAGRLIEVTDLASAPDALDEIVREGEGLPVETLGQTVAEHATRAAAAGTAPAHVDDGDELPYGWKMYSHYARFREIREGRRYRPTQLVADRPAGDVLPVEWAAVLPAAADPKARHVKGTAAWAPMVECDLTYSDLVDTLYRAYNGEPQVLQSAVPVMYDLKYQAVALMRTPSPLDPSTTLGPGFEYLPATARTDHRLQAAAGGRPFPEHPGMTITRRS
jgi:Ferritin-like